MADAGAARAAIQAQGTMSLASSMMSLGGTIIGKIP